MLRFRPFYRFLIALIAMTGISAACLAQSPPATPPASTPATPVPETPAPTAPPTPAPSATPAPPAAQTPPAPPAVQTADPFGEEITLTAKTAVVLKGSAKWDSAFETLTDSLKKLAALLEKQGIKPPGNFRIAYTSTDEDGFTYQAETPVDREPKSLPKDASIAKPQEAKALKFVTR